MRKRAILVLAVASVCFGAGVARADLSDGLIAYYPFNGNADDETGGGHDGVVCGATPTSDRFGNADSAYRFDGVDDCIELANPADFAFKDQSFSVSLWVKILQVTGWYQNYICINDASDGLPNFTISQASSTFDSKVYTEIWEYGGFRGPGQSIAFTHADGQQLPTNEWLHFVSVVDHESDELRLYLNGSLQETDRLIDFDLSAASSLKAYIGSSAYWFDPHYGPIDDVRIYNRALTQDEVGKLYVIPAPGAVVLGSIGLSFSGWLLRRRRTI